MACATRRSRRRNALGRTKRRYDARREAGLCTRCGLQPPVEGHTACEPCRIPWDLIRKGSPIKGGDAYWLLNELRLQQQRRAEPWRR